MGQADVLAVLRAGGPMTTREIAEHLPWSPSVSDNSRIGVVNKALRKLRRDGLVESYGPSPQMHRATGGGERMNGLEALKALREGKTVVKYHQYIDGDADAEHPSKADVLYCFRPNLAEYDPSKGFDMGYRIWRKYREDWTWREDASPTSWWLFTKHNFEIEEESE